MLTDGEVEDFVQSLADAQRQALKRILAAELGLPMRLQILRRAMGIVR